MARKTKAEAERTREALIDAAIAVFLERGVSRTTLDEVARVAGMTRGAVYWHFRDKLDLFLAMEERARLPLEELVARIEALDGADLLGALAEAVAGSFTDLVADPARRRTLTVLLLRCEYTPDMAPALERQRRNELAFEAGLTEVFRRAAAKGQLAPPWTADLAGATLRALCFGLVQSWLFSPESAPMAANGAAMVRALIGSMRAAAPGPG